jgi:hypothetical protein
VSSDIDWTRLVALDDVRFANEQHRRESDSLWKKAAAHVGRRHRGEQIVQRFLGLSEAGLIGVFLLRLRAADGTERWVWVVAGDVPPLSLPADTARNQYQALANYVHRVSEWLDSNEGKQAGQAADLVDASMGEQELVYLRRKLALLDRHVLARARDLL